jgi:2-polyprenyl-3-methyl-5-hydroxy-6-metoxy-1,4-benzoquinol methylase
LNTYLVAALETRQYVTIKSEITMSVKKIIRKVLSPFLRSYDARIQKNKEEITALYKLLYDQVHDLDQTIPLSAKQTVNTFGFQWENLQEGEAMLSDEWFKDNVTDIISEKEILIKKEWCKGKDVLDCGCGGGRWSYGLAKMGANITAVDINLSAIDATKDVLKDMPVKKDFVQAPLKHLSKVLPENKKFDLVWSWGVLHHCASFNTAFSQAMDRVKDGGFIYLYLYGRESLSYESDIELFKNRVKYNTLASWEEKEQFLIENAGGDTTKLHQNHDIFAPLLNRRLEFDYVKKMLEDNGFTNVTRTVKSTELYIRATKGQLKPEDKDMLLSPEDSKHWAERYAA